MEDNVIYVGKDKPLQQYAISVLTVLSNGHNDVIIKSRGACNNINLSLHQYLMNRVFVDKLSCKAVNITSEKMINKKGIEIYVTCLSILFRKKHV